MTHPQKLTTLLILLAFLLLPLYPTRAVEKLNDHLSSANLITDANGAVVQKLDYLPFGAERVNENKGGMTDDDWISAVSGAGLNLDGIDDYISKANPSFINDAAGAVSLWVKRDNSTNDQMIWAISDETGSNEFYLYLSSAANYNRLRVDLTVSGQYILRMYSDSNAITDSNWHHIVLQSDGSTIKLYIDAIEKSFTVFVGSNSGQWFSSAANCNFFTIGGLKQASLSFPFNGDVDEIRVYSIGLTAEQIDGLFQNPAEPDAAIANLSLYWSFDEGRGLTAYDGSGNGNNGALGSSFETRFTFTDQEKDAESGLLYYGARYYDPSVGRFLSADPVVVDNVGRKEFAMALQNPQMLNGYSYVGNNPLKYADESGEFAFIAIPLVAYAPVWVPAAVTAVGAIGGAVAAAFYGQALGYYSAGADQQGDAAIGNEMLTLEATATVATGLMSVEAMAGKTTSSNNTVNRQSVGQQQKTNNVTIPSKQLQEKFKHAPDFGIKGNYNKTTASEFSSAIQEHINDQGTQVIQGSYRKQPAILYLNQNTRLTVVTKPYGEFVTGYKLGNAQLQNVLNRGSLQ